MSKFAFMMVALLLPGIVLSQPLPDRCDTARDAEVRLGCHQARKVPVLAACHGIAEPQAQLACYDQAMPPVDGAVRVLPPRACSPVVEREAKLACFLKSYAVHIDREGPGYCFTLTGTDERNACFEAVQKKQDEPPRPHASRWTVAVREKDLPRAQKLEEPATIGLARADGQSRGLLKAAVSARGGAINSWGWQPFISAQVDHDLTDSNSRSNSKSAGAGLSGAWGDSAAWTAVDTTLQFKFKEDDEAHTQSRQVVVDNTLVSERLLRGYPFSPTGGHELLPILGVLREDIYKAKAGSPTGTATAVYAALKLGVWSRLLPRVQFNAFAQRFIDVDVASTRTKRYKSYYKVGADWYLYDPSLATVKFNPIIGLAREYGTNPLDAETKKSVTSLAVRFKFDFP